jgi:hypothetical protein
MRERKRPIGCERFTCIFVQAIMYNSVGSYFSLVWLNFESPGSRIVGLLISEHTCVYLWRYPDSK